jgi:hypothetical protein
LLPLLLLLLFPQVRIAQAQTGRGSIIEGVRRYNNADFEGAIGCFQAALTDLKLIRADSTVALSYLGACNAKLERPEARDSYFETVLRRNRYEVLPKELRDDSDLVQAFEVVRARIAGEYSRQLVLNSTPAGADIYLGGSAVGRTPATIDSLQVGRAYAITLQKQGYYTSEINLDMAGDTSITVDLQKLPDTVVQVKNVYMQPRTGVRSYLVGTSAGAALGLASFGASVLFDNNARADVKARARARDSIEAANYKEAFLRDQALGNAFYYASYPLIAVGFYAGLRLAEKVFPEYQSLTDEGSPTRLYCALSEDLNLTVGVRRSIW